MTALFVSFDILKYPKRYSGLAKEILNNVLSRTYVRRLDLYEAAANAPDCGTGPIIHF
ncbi:hypothetical protein [Planktotalea sp.]|uniref:hypothetical protein n=1 Tax=Planktotalea sp. TaxID=2029877 RepID=UPI0035C83491